MEPIQGILNRSFQPGLYPISQLSELRAEAGRIFEGYALSPADYSEATRRYVELQVKRQPIREEPHIEQIIHQILYSLDCENVWHRAFQKSIGTTRDCVV